MLLSSKKVGACVRFESDAWVYWVYDRGEYGWEKKLTPGERFPMPLKLSKLRWPTTQRAGGREARYGKVVAVHDREYVVQALDGAGEPTSLYVQVEAKKLDEVKCHPAAVS